MRYRVIDVCQNSSGYFTVWKFYSENIIFFYRSENINSGAYTLTNICCCVSFLAIEGVFQGPNPHYSYCDHLNSQVSRGDYGQHPHCPSYLRIGAEDGEDKLCRQKQK